MTVSETQKLLEDILATMNAQAGQITSLTAQVDGLRSELQATQMSLSQEIQVNRQRMIGIANAAVLNIPIEVKNDNTDTKSE